MLGGTSGTLFTHIGLSAGTPWQEPRLQTGVAEDMFSWCNCFITAEANQEAEVALLAVICGRSWKNTKSPKGIEKTRQRV